MRNEQSTVRAAMDRRLSALQADSARREQILQRIREESEPIMKKKLTVSLAMALAVVLALGGVALALTMNLFEVFGEKDERLKEIAPDTALTTQNPVAVESEELGQSNACIDSAYYDGQSLIVTYAVRNGAIMEAYTPSEEELQRMTKREDVPAMPAANKEEAVIVAEYAAAVEAGTPYGYVKYVLSPGDHTVTDDGIDLPPSTERMEPGENGMVYHLREYESPLPEGVQNRDELSISIGIRREAQYVWFDGKDAYMRSEHENAGAMTATVPRTQAEIVRFVGEVEQDGIRAAAQVEVSAVHVTSVVELTEGALPELSAGEWYETTLADENGNQFSMVKEVFEESAVRVEHSLGGIGRIPSELTLCLWIDGEGERDTEQAMKDGLTITLLPETK